jgi:hypothetical protein
MNTNNSITAAVFTAFLKCPTKAHLLAIGERAPDTYFADIEARIRSIYKTEAKRRQHAGGTEPAEPLEFGQLRGSPDCTTITHIDCEAAVYNFTLPQHRTGRRHSHGSPPSVPFVPVLFLPWNKPNACDSLLVCFGALALSQVTGILPDIGTLFYGECYRQRTVKTGKHFARTQQIIDAIRSS